MRLWIDALLSDEPIEKGSKDKSINQIATPPKFVMPSKGSLLPASAQRTTRSRASRSVSPSKIATPSRKMASPRKPRTTRGSKKAGSVSSVNESIDSKLSNVLENGTTESVASQVSESVDEDVARLEVTTTVETNGNVETTTTSVKVEMPADAPELPLPENPEEMIARAKAMVEEANRLDGKQVNGVKPKKRGAEHLEEEEGESPAAQPAKKVKKLEEQVKKDTVTRKAMFGIGALVALGSVFLSSS